MRRSILRATVLAVACAVLLFALPLGAAALRLYQQDEEQELQPMTTMCATESGFRARYGGIYTHMMFALGHPSMIACAT